MQPFLLDVSSAIEKAGPSVVAVNARTRLSSSGVHWKPGVIVTAEHAIKHEEEITVTLADGKSVGATLAGRDPGTDLAVLKLSEGNPQDANFADPASLKIGILALALGRSGSGTLGASLGIISSVGGPWRTWRGGQVEKFVRPDVTFYPGFSGGPLVDGEGRILGINTAALSRRAGVTMPVSTVDRVVSDLLSKGRVARGFLGLGLHPVRLPDGRQGMMILAVEPNGAADKGGLLLGDILIALDGKPVSDTDDVQAALGYDSVGKSLQASIIRGGAPAQVSLTVGERPHRER